MSISKKTALITGCSDGGLGAAMVKVLLEKDYHVFATLRNTSKAQTLGGLSGVEILELDVSSKDSIARCAEKVRHRTSTLDLLINNAGSDFHMPLLDTDIENAKIFFDVNFWSVLAVTQAFADPVVKARGVIVNCSSVLWNIHNPWTGIYTTAKAATKQISETMRVEMEPLGVRVVTPIIGGVATNFFINALNEPFHLPENSYYKPIEKILENQHGGGNVRLRQDVDVTARNIMNDVLGGASGCIWRGARSTEAKWLSWILPPWALEWLANRSRGLEELRQHYLNK
ncbi:putative short-chain dehydrogenase/reductase [Hypoxylon argillaceum]|nr:putative short-chain dehydrogenase/reductase [Hypoxylon argillaceum]